MTLSVAVSPTPGPSLPGISGAAASDGSLDFAAILQSVTGGAAASPEALLGALTAEAPTGQAGTETAADPLQALLAGLLAFTGEPPAGDIAEAGETLGEAEPLGDDALAALGRSKRTAADATALSAVQADKPAALAADSAAASKALAPAAAKLADIRAAEDPLLDHGSAETGLDGPLPSTHTAPGAAPGVSAARTAVATAHVAAPVGSQTWAAELGQRVVMLARSDVQSAQITVHPANLGPIEVRLSLNGGEATAVFVSPHSDVREALETALPRLREMFASAGIELGQAQVNSQSRGSAGQGEANGHTSSLAERAEVTGVLADNEAVRVSRPIGRGLIDTFV